MPTGEENTTPNPTPGGVASVAKLVDAVFILITSFAIAFLVLWAASTLRGQTMFEELPRWLVAMVSSVWTQLTAAAGALGFIVRCVLAAGDRRNYLLPCGITSAVIIIAIVGVAKLLPPPKPLVLTPLDLWFQVIFDPPSSKPVDLEFGHTRPEGRLPIRIRPQARGDYLMAIKVPQTAGEQYLGYFHRLIQDLKFQEPPPDTVVCLERSEVGIKSVPRELFIECPESKSCALKPGVDQAWVRPCIASPRASSWLATANAQPTAAPSAPGWIVPSLETLKEMGGSEGLGYTVFQFETDPLPSLQKVDGVVYRIRVNGRPVYLGGWKPERLRTPFDATRGLALAFGLQNLDFAGAKAGTEEIEVTLEFLTQDRKVRTVQLRLNYVALRDAGPAEVKDDGIVVRWHATYARPKREHKFEIFLFDEPLATAADAELRKKRLDDAQLRIDGQTVVGVIRPPLPPNRNFGIVLGLEQPTSQIRFTFDEATANRLCREVLILRPGLISRHAFRYEMEPRRVGIAPTKPCRSL